MSSTSPEPPIIVDVIPSGIATVAFNRPEKRNAVTLAMWIELYEIFVRLNADPQVRIVLLTGRGGNFCAGADISEFERLRNNPEDAAKYAQAGDRAERALRDLAKPTIAAVSGFGVGGGCGLALACDIRVGDETTRMGIPAARLGIVYGRLDTEMLLRQVGMSKAKLVLYSGRVFPAVECLDMGLLDIVGGASAESAALSLAQELAQMAPLSQRGAKQVLELIDAHDPDIDARVTAAIDAALTSSDYREGRKAFQEKRPPRFLGQ